MAKRNVDRLFEKFSPVSSGRATDRTSVLEQTGEAAPRDAVDGTRSGNTKAIRGAMLKLGSINDLVTGF